jgi:uracil-DNA glycosylase
VRVQLPFYDSIDDVRREARACLGCVRSRQRTQVVFGNGDPNAALMLVGEYPSEPDDRTGEPFSGPAGVFLDELLGEIGLSRDRVWLTNIVRCYATHSGERGGELRSPRAAEIGACALWMNLEIQFVNPKVIVALGAPAAHTLISPDLHLTEDRGSWHRRHDGRMMMATFQPAYALRMRAHDPGQFPMLRELISTDLGAAARRADLSSA